MQITNSTLHALVVDDEPQIREFVATVLCSEGWVVAQAASAEEALQMLDAAPWSVVFSDVMLEGADGYAVLRCFKERLPEAKVVLMTGYGSAAGALDATAFGAYDYLLKPFGPEELSLLAASLREQVQERCRRINFKRQLNYRSNIDLVGRSHAFIEVMKQVGRVANTDLPVLLTGESGTGKEVVASAIHQRSRRADQPFVAVNCGAIPSELIEAELFGHVKGSFTGADRDRPGLWKEADGGTLFLDEITETTLSFQVKLLRVLQQGEIRPVGSNQNLKVDVRIIAASNRNFEAEIKASRFREDLFYRLNAVSILLPPLRERREDILPLAQRFARRAFSPGTVVNLSPETLRLLEQYDWPGNIRELENAVVHAAAMCDGTIRVKDLPERIRNYTCELDHEIVSSRHAVTERLLSLSQVEAEHVARVLGHTGGNKQAATRILGVDRKTLDRMIKRHKIDFKRQPRTKGLQRSI